MSHQTSYTEHNGLGHTTRHVIYPPPRAAHRREVEAWFAVWRSLSEQQKAAWRALSKDQKEATKTLDAADFALVMGK